MLIKPTDFNRKYGFNINGGIFNHLKNKQIGKNQDGFINEEEACQLMKKNIVIDNNNAKEYEESNLLIKKTQEIKYKKLIEECKALKIANDKELKDLVKIEFVAKFFDKMSILLLDSFEELRNKHVSNATLLVAKNTTRKSDFERSFRSATSDTIQKVYTDLLAIAESLQEVKDND